MSNSQISKDKSIRIKTKKSKSNEFDMSKGTLWSVFRKIWIPTLVSMVLGGTLVVFDSMFVSMGFGPHAMFAETGLNIGGGAYAALGAGAIATVQPYFLLIAALGVMVGAGTAMKMGKAKAKGDMMEYQRILNSFIPKTIIMGGAFGIFLIIMAKPLIYLGSGAQPTYMDNWNNNPIFQGGGFTNVFGGGGWSEFAGMGGFEAMEAAIAGESFSNIDEFALFWDSHYASMTGLSGNQILSNDFLRPQIEAIIEAGGETMAADLTALTMSETQMAAGHVLDEGTRYLQVQALFGIMFMIASSGTFVLRMEGKAHIGTVTGVMMLVVNLGLDFLLVNILGGNLMGAVLATVMAQTVAALFTVWYLKNKFPTRLTKMDWGFAKSTFGSTMKEGIPSFALQLAGIVLQWGTILSMGIVFWGDWTMFSVLTSGFQGFFSMYTMFFLIATGTIMSITPIISYNNAIGNFARVKAARTLAYSIVIVWAAGASAVGVFIPQHIALVGSKHPGTTMFAMQYSFMAYIGGAITLLNANYHQARGNVKMSNVASFFKPLFIIPVSIGLGFGMKNIDVSSWMFMGATTSGPALVGAGLFLAGPILDLLGGIITSVPLASDFRKLAKQEAGKIIPTADEKQELIAKPKAAETKVGEIFQQLNEKDPEQLTVEELKTYAKRIGLTIPAGSKKADLVFGVTAWRHPENLTVVQLKSLASNLQIEGRSKMNKLQLVKAIKAKH